MSEDSRPRTAAILTLGCKLNITGPEVMARRLRAGDWTVGDPLSATEAVVATRSPVTPVADPKWRHSPKRPLTITVWRRR